VFVPETSSHDDEEESIEVVEILAAHHENKDYLAEKKYYGELGVTEILLKNGAHIIMRPTIDEESKIHISALGRGGLGDIPDSLYMHLKDAVGYVDMGGISTIDADTLGMIMGQKELMLNMGMDNYWHESLVTSSTADAQILMNLLYEKLHHPGTAYTDFEECKKQELDSYGKETALEMQLSNDPGRMLNACVDSLFGNIVGAHFLPHSRKDIEAMNLDDMTNYYRQVFTDPDGLYLIITGNFDVDSIGAMAVSTFGRMTRPAVPFVRRMDKEQVPNAFTGRFGGLEPSMTCCNLIFPGNYHPGLRQSLMFKLMRDILQARLISVMRQRDNIVYSPFANVFYNGEPQQIMWFRLYIDVKNENFDKMMADMMEIVGELSSKPVSEAELQKMKRSFIVTKRQALNDVSTSEWKNAIAGLIRNGESLSDFNNYDEVLEAITPKMLQEAFAKYVKMENLILLYQKE
nr:insulinase family protein [Bacteroidaceae bacterium]